MVKRLFNRVITCLITTIFAASTFAQQASNASDDLWGDSTWADEKPSPWQITGFIEGGYGQFTQSNIVSSAQSLHELTARLAITYQHDYFDINAKADARYDGVLAKALWDTRELNITFSPLQSLDLKLGRQVLTWGTGDYLFLNDLFAKDWRSFFSGRDDEYLKAASDSIRATYYINDISIDLAWTPEHTTDNYITGQRFSFYSPEAQQQVAPADNFVVNKTDNSQWAIRVASTQNSVEYALYGYHGFWATPVGTKINENSQSMAYFPTLNAWGASVRMPIASGVFNAEYSAYNSSEDNTGSNPLIANSQHRALLGYETEVIKNVTASMQYYLEKMRHYSPFIQSHIAPESTVSEYRQLVTLRLTYLTLQQKLTYSLFSFYSPSDKDGYIKPSISYRHNDQYQLSLGANVFFGDDDFSFFGQHQSNSNVWLRAKFTF